VAEDCTGVRGQPSQPFMVETGQPSLCIDFKEENVVSATSTYSLESYVGFGLDDDDAILLSVNVNEARRLILQGVGEDQQLEFEAEYNVVVTYMKAANFGKWQLSIGSNQFDTIVDGYSAILQSAEIDLGKMTINPTVDQPTFRFTVRDKNSASSSYSLAIDKICLK